MINSLDKLIKNYGEPDALIDHWRKPFVGYAIWGFEETILWDYSGLYESGRKIVPDINELQRILNKWKKYSSKISAIGFINYNFKNILYPHLLFKNYNKNFPYLFFGKPINIQKYKIENSHNNYTKLNLKKDFLDYNQYCKKIEKIKLELEQGNVYQINFTNDKQYECNDSSFNIYMNLRKKAQPEYGYYINYKNYKILSFSPELFFKKENNTLISYPMKGTRPRSINSKKDQKLKVELKNSLKDKAEHLMIVDLLRNDIGKIAIPGSVSVDDMFKVNSYQTVHQMISCIKGKLDNSIQEQDIICALFPGGSVTGAPKESAMKIIDNLENYSRDIYTGSIGYITPNGNLNFNIAIRTMTINNNIAKYPVGGGIVWDSIPIQEWEEAQLKSKILNSIVTSNG